MASRSKLVAIALPLVAAASLAVVLLLLCTTYSPEDGYLGRVGTPWGGTVTVLPFSPTDVLPLLPRGVAMAALRALRGVSDIFPVFVGAASAGGSGSASSSGGTVRWKGACFYENEAWLVFHNESGSKYGGGTLHIKKMEQEKLEKLAHKGPSSGEQASSTTGSAASDVKAGASPTESASASVSSDKNRNYAVLAGTIAALSGLGWYLLSKPKKSEEVVD